MKGEKERYKPVWKWKDRKSMKQKNLSTLSCYFRKKKEKEKGEKRKVNGGSSGHVCKTGKKAAAAGPEAREQNQVFGKCLEAAVHRPRKVGFGRRDLPVKPPALFA